LQYANLEIIDEPLNNKPEFSLFEILLSLPLPPPVASASLLVVLVVLVPVDNDINSDVLIFVGSFENRVHGR
jgi:hypothetical protein